MDHLGRADAGRRRGFSCGLHRRYRVRCGLPRDGPGTGPPGVPAGAVGSALRVGSAVRSDVVRPTHRRHLGIGNATPPRGRGSRSRHTDAVSPERHVLITGATGSLGRVAAAAFAADGARLGLIGTDGARLQGLARDLRLDDDRWAAGVGDLRDADACLAAVGAVVERLGPVDVLLHLVGGWTGGTALTDLQPSVLDEMLGQHVWSTFHVARAIVPAMQARGFGRIVAVTSSYAAAPGPRMAAYVAAKAAQETILRVLAREVAGQGVTVNLIAVKTIDAKHERETDPSPRNASWTTPEEIVATMRYLCSDEAAAVNGQRIPLDGR